MSIFKKKLIWTGLKYGIAGGLITILYQLFLFYLGKSILDPALTLLTGMVILLFVLFAVMEYRQYDKITRFWKNMTIGIIIYLLIGIFSAIFVFIMIKWVDKDMIHAFINNRVNMMMENKEVFIDRFDQETFDKAVEGVKNTQPHHLALDRLIKDVISGLFVTILISAIFHFIYNKNLFTNRKSN